MFPGRSPRLARYQDLVRDKENGAVYESLMPVSGTRIVALREEYPGIPNDFIDFLVEVGTGILGGGRYQLYDGLVGPDDIYGVVEDGLEMVALFGDDLQGFNTGFDTRDWQVIEVDPTNATFRHIALSFEAFIRDKIAELT